MIAGDARLDLFFAHGISLGEPAGSADIDVEEVQQPGLDAGGFGDHGDPAGLFLGHAARWSSRRARWVVLRRSRGVPFQYASSRRRLRAQAMYTWSRRVLGSPR